MKKLFSVLAIFILFVIPNLSAQENEKGVIQIYSIPDKVNVNIVKLKFNGTLLKEQELIVRNVPEGKYNFRFSRNKLRLNARIFIAANDTISVMANFIHMEVTSATAKELRKIEKERKRINRIQDSISLSQRRKFEEIKRSDTAIIFGDTITLKDEFVDEEVFYIVEEMPLFNGGHPATEFRKFIAQNLRYPDHAAENKIKGRVIVQFAIDSEGKLVDPVVVAGVDPSLDQEAIRVVNLSPLWTPGRQRGVAVKVLFTFPINFVL